MALLLDAVESWMILEFSKLSDKSYNFGLPSRNLRILIAPNRV